MADAIDRQWLYFRTAAARLQSENDLLRAEIEDLRERLESAEAPAVDDCPDDRERWTFRFQFANDDLVEVKTAICNALDRALCRGDDRDADALAEVCRLVNSRDDLSARLRALGRNKGRR